jgi:hypothetical protein
MNEWPDIQDDSESEKTEPAPTDDRSAELDGVRIRQLSALRRAAYRSRSHAVIAMLVCAVAVVHTSVLLVQHLWRIGWGWNPLVYIAVILLAAFGTVYFTRRALALHREATQTQLTEPKTPPDLSQLSDGSQRWKDLEELK